VIVLRRIPDETSTLPQRFRQWLLGYSGRAFGISCGVHLLLLLALSFSIIHGEIGTASLSTLLSQAPAESKAPSLDIVLDKDSEAGGSQGDELPAFVGNPLMAQAALSETVSIDEEIEDVLAQAAAESAAEAASSPGAPTGAGKGKGKGTGHGDRTGGFAMPSEGNVVRKGSFTAWTVPSDPRPRQKYLIIIQVDWPEPKPGEKVLRGRGDVRGTVEGTDGYFLIIERHSRYISKARQIVIPIPGAERNVRDLIRVHSRSLDESQQLLIDF